MSNYNKKTESDNTVFGLGFLGALLSFGMIFLGRSCISYRPKKHPSMIVNGHYYHDTITSDRGFPVLGWILIIIGIIIVIITIALIVDYIKSQNVLKKAEERNNKAIEKTKRLAPIVQAITKEIVGNRDYNAVKPLLANLEEMEKKSVLIDALNGSLETFLEDGIIDETEEQITKDYVASFGLTQKDLEDSGIMLRMVKLITISQLLQGQYPDRFNINERDFPINLMKNEHVIWATSCSYYETTTKRSYVGSSSGLSIRIAKGVYYRTSGFKGQPIITTELRYKGAGVLIFTNKHLYYHSSEIAFRIKYDKIISYYNYEDGLGVMKDGKTAKPQYFKDFDGWFAYNIVKNIGNIE